MQQLAVLIPPILVSVAINDPSNLIDNSMAFSLVQRSVSSLNYANVLNNIVMSGFVTAITLLYYLRKRIGNLGLKTMTQSSVKTLISSVFMGIVVYFIYNYSVTAFNPSRFVELVIVLLSVVMGIAVYVVALYLFKVEELHFAIDYAKRQLEERKKK